MGTFNTYGNKSRKYGGAVPVWFTVRQKEKSGGVLESDYIKEGTLLRAGSLVSLDEIGGEAKVVATFEVASDVSATDAVLKVRAYPSHSIPKDGMALMKAPDSIDKKGKAGTIADVTLNNVDGVYEITITAGELGTLKEGDVLVRAKASGATAEIYATPTGLTENDVWIDEGDYAATVASVFDGEIMEDRIQPIPSFVKTLLPMIKFTKGV